jgi:hypothetical protein
MALDSWASALILRSYSAPADERASLLEAAVAHAREANAASPHSGDYNLACALCLFERSDEAVPLLLAALSHDPHKLGQALSDRDFERLWRSKPELRRELEARLAREKGSPRPS